MRPPPCLLAAPSQRFDSATVHQRAPVARSSPEVSVSRSRHWPVRSVVFLVFGTGKPGHVPRKHHVMTCGHALAVREDYYGHSRWKRGNENATRRRCYLCARGEAAPFTRVRRSRVPQSERAAAPASRRVRPAAHAAADPGPAVPPVARDQVACLGPCKRPITRDNPLDGNPRYPGVCRRCMSALDGP